MSFFENIIHELIELEGGYVNHPKDKGGKTKYGISNKFLNSINKILDINKITKEDAKKLYKEYFWDFYKFDLLPENEVTKKLFFSSVNMGFKNAVRILQSSINVYLANRDQKNIGFLIVDGFLGVKTRYCLNNAEDGILLQIFKKNLCDHYKLLVNNGKVSEVFIKGLINRALS